MDVVVFVNTSIHCSLDHFASCLVKMRAHLHFTKEIIKMLLDVWFAICLVWPLFYTGYFAFN